MLWKQPCLLIVTYHCDLWRVYNVVQLLLRRWTLCTSLQMAKAPQFVWNMRFCWVLLVLHLINATTVSSRAVSSVARVGNSKKENSLEAELLLSEWRTGCIKLPKTKTAFLLSKPRLLESSDTRRKVLIRLRATLEQLTFFFCWSTLWFLPRAKVFRKRAWQSVAPRLRSSL